MLRLTVPGGCGDDRDAEGVLQGNRVLDEACGEGLFQSPQLPFVEAGDGDLDLKILQAQWPLAGLCPNADEETL